MESLIKNYFSFLPKSTIKAGEGIDDGEYPFFTSSDIKVSSLNTYLIDDEILAIGTGGKASCNYYDGKCSYSTDNFAIKSKGEVLTKFLYYFLRKDNLQILENGFHGAGLKHISKEYFANIKFPLLEIEKQKEIVEAFDVISLAKEKCSKNISQLDELVKSRFIEMFGDPNLNNKNWEITRIDKIGKCVAGATPSTAKKEYWENGTIPWMSSGEVHKYRVYNTDDKITQLGYDNASTKLVPPHTVVLAMAGQGKTRGTAAITEIELCTNQSICSIVNNETINPWFLLFYLKNQYDELRGASNGADGRGGLNLNIIGAFPIYLPPIELQNQFANFVEQIDKSKYILQQQLKQLNELFEAKLNEYFPD